MKCVCGCGVEVKIGCRFVSGHNSRMPNFINGMKGKKHSLKAKENMKKSHANDAERFADRYEDTSRRFSGSGNPFYGKVHTSETKDKMRKAKLGKPFVCKNPEERGRKISIHHSGEGNPFYGKKHSEETLGMLREIALKKWMDPEYVSKIRHGRPLVANKVETELQGIINGLELPYRYTGDGQFSIGTKIPDFVNTNGQKKVIELLGCYWHGCKQCYPDLDRVNDLDERVQLFKSFGYSTLGIWEH